MLPVVVSVIAGGLATSLKNQGLGGLFSQLASGASAPGQQGGGLMGMLSGLLGSLFGGQQGIQGGLDSLSKILQPGTPAASTSSLQDEIGKILASHRS